MNVQILTNLFDFIKNKILRSKISIIPHSSFLIPNLSKKGFDFLNKNYTPKQYDKYVSEKAPKSPIFKDIILAFLVGGGICLAGQVIFNLLKAGGIDTRTSLTGVSMILIGIGAFLTGVGLYGKLGKAAGAGSIVPITGFANAIVSPAMEFKTEGLVFGLAAKMFTIAGPVIVYGTISSIVVGLVRFYM